MWLKGEPVFSYLRFRFQVWQLMNQLWTETILS